MKFSKNIRIIYAILPLFFLFGCKKPGSYIDPNTDVTGFKEGDIIFQTSLSAQSKAIQLATHSKYSHCGIIYKNEAGRYLVFEAIQPVKTTPLLAWVARGEGSHFAVKRLKDADKVLTPQAVLKMKSVGKAMNGKDYDLYFEWNNDRIYCSELVWKMYKEATGLEVGHLQKLKDFDLDNPAVQKKLRERYGKNIPIDEKVISPSEIFDSELLTTVATE